MHSKFHSPEIFSIASSKVGESSYSYTVDMDVGLSVMDRFTHQLCEFLQAAQPSTSLQQLIDHFEPAFLASTPVVRSDLFTRPAGEVLLSEFFSGRHEGHAISKNPIEGIRNFQWPPKRLVKQSAQSNWERPSFVIKSIDNEETAHWYRVLLVTVTLGALLMNFLFFSSKPNKQVSQ